MGHSETDAKPTGRRKAATPPKPGRPAEAARTGKVFTFDTLTAEDVARLRRSAYDYAI